VHAQGRARAAATTPAEATTAGGVEINLLRIDGLEGALLPETRFLYLWATPGG